MLSLLAHEPHFALLREVRPTPLSSSLAAFYSVFVAFCSAFGHLLLALCTTFPPYFGLCYPNLASFSAKPRG